jgi:hypothetical protein
LNQILFHHWQREEGHQSSSANLDNKHRKRSYDSTQVKIPDEERDLTLLINWQICSIFDVLETFCLDLSAIAEINISAFLLTTEDGLFMITADNLAANALERFDNGVDNNNGVDVIFDDAVNAQAYDAASGVTTSATSVDFANFMLRAKQTVQDSASSVNLPVSFFPFAGVLGMIAVE